MCHASGSQLGQKSKSMKGPVVTGGRAGQISPSYWSHNSRQLDADLHLTQLCTAPPPDLPHVAIHRLTPLIQSGSSVHFQPPSRPILQSRQDNRAKVQIQGGETRPRQLPHVIRSVPCVGDVPILPAP